MSGRRARWLLTAAAVIMVGGGLVLTGAARGQQGTLRCSLADDSLQPDSPLELNHVASGTLVKTLAMEKEVFVCTDAETGRITQVRDVETFVEVVEALVDNKSVRRLEIGLQVAECTKDFSAGTVKCRGSKRDGSIAFLTPEVLDFRTCRPHENVALQPRDPVEMGTAFLGRTWAKTTKVEKEVLACGERTVDLYLFTEIVERRTAFNANTFTMRPVGLPRFFAIVCIKDTPTSSLGGVNTNNCYRHNPV